MAAEHAGVSFVEVGLEKVPGGVDQLVRLLGAHVTAPHDDRAATLETTQETGRLRVVQ